MTALVALPRPLSAQAEIEPDRLIPCTVWLACEVAGDVHFVVVGTDGLVDVVKAGNLRVLDETLRHIAQRSQELLAGTVEVPA